MQNNKGYRFLNLGSFRNILLTDTKAGLIISLKILGLKVSLRQKKGDLVDTIENLFNERPFYIIDCLPKAEQDLLSKLIGCRQSEYVEVPISEQRLGLVSTQLRPR